MCCQLKGITSGQSVQYTWKLGNEVIQDGSDYTIDTKDVLFGTQLTHLLVALSPLSDTTFTCIAAWDDVSIYAAPLLDIIQIEAINKIVEDSQTVDPAVITCQVSGWAFDLNQCNQLAWLNLPSSSQITPTYTGKYLAELSMTSVNSDQTYTCRCDRTMVDDIDVAVHLDFISMKKKDLTNNFDQCLESNFLFIQMCSWRIERFQQFMIKHYHVS